MPIASTVLNNMPAPLRFALAGLCLLLLALPIALLPLPYALVLVGGVTMLLLTIIDPVWALYAAVLAVPAQDLILLPGGISLVQAAVLLGVASWGLHILAHPHEPVLFGRPFAGLMLVGWALVLATALTPYNQNEAIKETVRWVLVVLVYLLAVNRLAAPGGWRAGGLVACLLLAPGINAIVGLWQFFTGTGPESFAIAGGFVRAYGTIGQPNSFAGYINMGWALAVALLGAALLHLWSQRTTRRASAVPLLAMAGAGLAAAVLLAALGASLSRGGWVGAVGGGVGLLLATALVLRHHLRGNVGRWLWLGVAAALALAVLGGSGLLPDFLTQRLATI
ncbi:MAG: hypothetical protein HC893_12835, partial [Chloroflexaceae bacterium]|nr:hypothetical protein [Chloroflexaceae bacterium]